MYVVGYGNGDAGSGFPGRARVTGEGHDLRRLGGLGGLQ